MNILMNKGSPYLFSVGVGDTVLRDEHNRNVMDNLTSNLPNVTEMKMSNYRAGQAVTELLIHFGYDKIFTLTIWEGELDVPPVSPCDMRLLHKEISLPDVTDILIFVMSLARYAGLQPSFPLDDSASILEFK